MALDTVGFPDGARLPHGYAEIVRSLRRLSREALTALALEWLKPTNQPECAPVLDPLAQGTVNTALASGQLSDLDQIRRRFERVADIKDSKKEVLEAIDTHWVAGLTLRQWAMADEARILAEMEAEPGLNAMQWSTFKVEEAPVDHGTVLSQYGSASTRRPSLLRLKPALLARSLQDYIDPLFKTHIYQMQPGKDYSVLRIVCFADDATCSHDMMLSGCEGHKTIYLALQDVGSTVHVSPATISSEGENLRSLVLRALNVLVSRGSRRVTFAVERSGPTLTCQMLFGSRSKLSTCSSRVTRDPFMAPGKDPPLAAEKTSVNLAKRKRIIELRAELHFQREGSSDESYNAGEL